jgi:medium-chain acyl-[acyl-carrier-protein] hydrolase
MFARRTATARQRLLCLPFAGGGATTYRPWVELLAPAAIDVWPVQLPGHENRLAEPLYTDLESLVEDLADELGPYLDDLPYAVFGHSVGAVVAYEFAREMRRQGLPEPTHLVVSARRPPHRPDPDPPAHALPREQLLTRLRRYGGDGQRQLSDDALVDLLLPTVRADLGLVERWAWMPEEPLACPVTVLAADADAAVPVDDLPPWSALTRGPFQLRVLPGGHFYLTEDVTAATSAVRDALASSVR